MGTAGTPVLTVQSHSRPLLKPGHPGSEMNPNYVLVFSGGVTPYPAQVATLFLDLVFD